MIDDETLTPAAERVLDVAGRLFYDNGIHAVGVEAIVAAADVTEKTFYDQFGSKDALVENYLRHRDEHWREFIATRVERSRVVPTQRVLLVFDALDEWIGIENPRGCAFVNALAELPDAGHPGREVIREQKQWLVDYLRELSREAGVRNARRMATSLFVLLEGAMVAASFGVVPGTVGNAKEVARSLLEG